MTSLVTSLVTSLRDWTWATRALASSRSRAARAAAWRADAATGSS